MVHILGVSSLCFMLAGFIGPAAFSGMITHKRVGPLHFIRIGRLSGSWCIRRKPVA